MSLSQPQSQPQQVQLPKKTFPLHYGNLKEDLRAQIEKQQEEERRKLIQDFYYKRKPVQERPGYAQAKLGFVPEEGVKEEKEQKQTPQQVVQVVQEKLASTSISPPSFSSSSTSTTFSLSSTSGSSSGSSSVSSSSSFPATKFPAGTEIPVQVVRKTGATSATMLPSTAVLREVQKYIAENYWSREILDRFIEFGLTVCKPRGILRELQRRGGNPNDVKDEEERIMKESQTLTKLLNYLKTKTETRHPFTLEQRKESKTEYQKPSSSSSVVPGFPCLGAGHYGAVYLVEYNVQESNPKNRIKFLDPQSEEAQKKIAARQVAVCKVLNNRFYETEDYRPYYSFLMESIICLILSLNFPDYVIGWFDVFKTPSLVSSAPPDVGFVMEYFPSTIHDFLWDYKESEDPLITYKVFLQITTMLEQLQRSFAFEHKDFRSRNIMCRMESDGKMQIKFADFGRSTIQWDGIQWDCVPATFYDHYGDSSSYSSPQDQDFRGPFYDDQEDEMDRDTRRSYRQQQQQQRSKRYGGNENKRNFSQDLALFFAEIYLEIVGRHPSLNDRESEKPGEKERIMNKLAYLQPLLKLDFLKGMQFNFQDEYLKTQPSSRYGGRGMRNEISLELPRKMKPIQYINMQIATRPKEAEFYSTVANVKEKLQQKIAHLEFEKQKQAVQAQVQAQFQK